MKGRTAILATALAFLCALAGLTIAAAVRGVFGALVGGSPEE